MVFNLNPISLSHVVSYIYEWNSYEFESDQDLLQLPSVVPYATLNNLYLVVSNQTELSLRDAMDRPPVDRAFTTHDFLRIHPRFSSCVFWETVGGGVTSTIIYDLFDSMTSSKICYSKASHMSMLFPPVNGWRNKHQRAIYLRSLFLFLHDFVIFLLTDRFNCVSSTVYRYDMSLPPSSVLFARLTRSYFHDRAEFLFARQQTVHLLDRMCFIQSCQW